MEKRRRNPTIWLLLLLLCLMFPAAISNAGLIKEGRYEYYRTEDGCLKNTWRTIRSKRCYFNERGRRVKNKTLTVKGVTYKFDKEGFMKAGLRRTAKGLRWQKENGKYLRKTWKRSGSSRYYFNKKGYAAKKKWIKSSYVDKNGKMVKSNWVGSKFVDVSGKKVTSASLSLTSPSAILIDADTGKVIYQKNAGIKRANASTTKIMTAVLALEEGDLSDIVTFSSYAAGQEAVKLYANPGEQFRLGDLLYALLLPSYNDVATAIGEHIGGSSSAFAKMMNKKAEELGCKNTTFVTASGLDEGNHGTTASDLAKMARYAFQKKSFRQIIKAKSYRFSSTSSGRYFNVYTTNRFLGSVSGAAGIKTGFTSRAGHCFVGALRNGERTYISVVLGAPGSDARWNDTNRLMNFAKQNYGT